MSTLFEHCAPNTVAILDFDYYYKNGYIITRVNVPVHFRKQGYGTKLMTRMCEIADKTHNNLYLEILASGEMSYEQLRNWYCEKFYFRELLKSGIFRRTHNPG